jgi:hypothetical protein
LNCRRVFRVPHWSCGADSIATAPAPPCGSGQHPSITCDGGLTRIRGEQAMWSSRLPRRSQRSHQEAAIRSQNFSLRVVCDCSHGSTQGWPIGMAMARDPSVRIRAIFFKVPRPALHLKMKRKDHGDRLFSSQTCAQFRSHNGIKLGAIAAVTAVSRIFSS